MEQQKYEQYQNLYKLMNQKGLNLNFFIKFSQSKNSQPVRSFDLSIKQDNDGGISTLPFIKNSSQNILDQLSHHTVDPFSKYFAIEFKTNVMVSQDLLETQINQYLRDLFYRFVPYSFLNLCQKGKNNQHVSISFKQFSSINIMLNIVGLLSMIQYHIISKLEDRHQGQKKRQWLLSIIQKGLLRSVKSIKEYYPEDKGINKEKNVQMMRKQLIKINRRANQQYDFFITNKIQYIDDPDQLIIKTIQKILQISKKGYKITETSQMTLQQEIFNFHKRIFSHKQNYDPNKINLGKIKEPFELKCSKKKDFIQIMGLNRSKSSPILRILIKFIGNLQQIIYKPQNITLHRNQYYKNCQNQLVMQYQKLNSCLFAKMTALKKQILENKLPRLKQLKERLLKSQSQIIFSHLHLKNGILQNLLQISDKLYKQTFLAVFQYLSELINLIIKVGVVIIDGQIRNINLVTLNVGDIFRDRYSVTQEEFPTVIKKILQQENPRKKGSLQIDKTVRIVRIKDKLHQPAKCILINYYFQNNIQCELQINTKEQSSNQLSEVNHFLYELERGQFGIITEIIIIIASYFKKQNHQVLLFRQIKQQNEIKGKIHENIQNFLMKNYEKSQIRQKQLNSWTEVFYKFEKDEEKPESQKVKKKKAQFKRIESLFNPNKEFLAEKETIEAKYTKNISIKIKNQMDLFALADLDLLILKKFVCLEKIVLNGFNQMNVKKAQIITDLRFINSFIFKYLTILDLASNQICSLKHFEGIMFQSLQSLNLCNNRLKGEHIFYIQWFPRLKALNLNKNEISQLKIKDYRYNPKSKLFPSELKLSQTSRTLQIERKQFMNYFLLLDCLINLTITGKTVTLILLIDNQFKQKKQEQVQPSGKSLKSWQFSGNIKQRKKHENIKKQSIKKQIPVQNSYVQTYKSKTINLKLSNHQHFQCINFKFKLKKIPESNIIGSLFLSITRFLAKQAALFQSMCGLIFLNGQKKQNGNGVKINPFIVIASAHTVVNKKDQQNLLNPYLYQKTKKQMLERLYFIQMKENKQIRYKCKQIWIPPQFLDSNSLQNKNMDICILFLQNSQKQKQEKQYLKLHVVFKQQQDVNLSCFLTSYIYGYLSDRNKINSLAIDAQFRSDRDYIEFTSEIPITQICSGSAVVFVKTTGKKSCQCYLLGVYKGLDFQKHFVSNINHQIKNAYTDMVYIQGETQFLPNNKEIIFESCQIFRNQLLVMIPLGDILKQKGNQLIFLRKTMQVFANILEQYLFIQDTDDNVTNFLKRVHIYHYQKQSGGDNYDIDLRGIRLKPILAAIQKENFQIDEEEQYIFCRQLLIQQMATLNVILKLFQSLTQQMQDENIKNLIIFLRNFLSRILKESNRKKPISLLKVLQVIIWIFDYREKTQIQTNLLKQQQNSDIFVDKTYFSVINILTNLNIFRRIKYYSEIMRSSKAVESFSVATSEKPQIGPLSLHINNENSIKLWIKLFKQWEQTYIKSLKKVNDLLLQKHQKVNKFISKYIKNVFMIQTIRNFYKTQLFSIDILKQVISKQDNQMKILIMESFSQKIKQCLKIEFQEQHAFSLQSNSFLFHKPSMTLINNDMKEVSETFLQNYQDEFSFISNIFRALFEQSRRQELKLQDKDQFLHKMQTQIKRHQQQQQQLIKKKQFTQPHIIKGAESGFFQRSRKPYSPITSLNTQVNEKIYKNHIGLITIFDHVLNSQKKSQQIAYGTGVLIDKKTVVSAAHVLTPFITGRFSLGKVAFKLSNQKSKGYVNVVECRLIRDQDLAILILEKEMINQPAIKLVTHNIQPQKSNFKGRSYHCQIVGYPVINNQQKHQLYRSYGQIFIQNKGLSDFTYTLSTSKGQSGSPILFFPTGDYKQPYILGIHTQGTAQSSDFLGINHKRYFNESYNRGRKFCKDIFEEDSKYVSIFVATGFKPNLQILNFPTIHENSYIFSESLYEIYKWRFIQQINKINFQQSPYKIFIKLYQQVLEFQSGNLMIQKMSPQNLLYLEEKSDSLLFNVNIGYLQSNNRQQFTRKQLGYEEIGQIYTQLKSKYTRIKLTQVINQYDRHICANQFINRCFQFIQRLNLQNGENIQECFKSYIYQFNTIFSEIKNFCKIQDNFNHYIRKINNIIKKTQQAKQKFPRDSIKQIQNSEKSFIFKNYCQFQQQFFNDQLDLQAYLISFNSSNLQETQKLQQMMRRRQLIIAVCNITSILYKYFIQNDIKVIKNQLKGVQNRYEKRRRLQLCKANFKFIPVDFYHIREQDLVSRYINDINKRAKAISNIEKISNILPQNREMLIRNIMSPIFIGQYWSHQLTNYNNQDGQQSVIDNIIKSIVSIYEYKENNEHFISFGKIILQQFYLLSTLLETKSFIDQSVLLKMIQKQKKCQQ